MPTLPDEEFVIRLPDVATGLEQDQEYVEVEVGDQQRRIRLHDYAEIFKIPGLYEQIYAEQLSCDSPKVVVDLLHDAICDRGEDPSQLRMLDFAAGNGMVGEELHRVEIGAIVGVDLLEEAKQAAERDRPHVYDAYHAVDLTDLRAPQRQALESHEFDGMVCVAALGFGDVPVQAFSAAFDLVDDGGWVAFNIRDELLAEQRSEFGAVLDRALTQGVIDEHASVTYQHRVNVHGEPLEYLAVVGRKHGDLSEIVAA